METFNRFRSYSGCIKIEEWNRINQRWLDSGNFFFTRLSLFAYQFCCCFFAVISRHCCWGLLQCLSWNQFAMRSTWWQVAVPRADGNSLHNYYPPCIDCLVLYVVIVFVGLICLFFIPYIRSGIRRCSFVVSFISLHLHSLIAADQAGMIYIRQWLYTCKIHY